MNCKPGDLAFIVGFHVDRHMNDMVVQVLGSVAHLHSATLPDGSICEAGQSGDWAVQFFREVLQRTSNGLGFSKYAVINDRNLRPIRNQPGEDETLQWAPVPGQKVEVPA